jgi:hypothetical protein
MIRVGVTWGDRVYRELVCDCKLCSKRKYKRKDTFFGDTFQECSFEAKRAGWLLLIREKKCYAPRHHKFQRKNGYD